MSAKRIFEFGDFTLDATDRLLYRSGEILRIPPKLLDTLVFLIERRGSVVTKDEIMQSVWPDTVVEEGGLARNISLLRKSLGEEESNRYIETIPKRGYRFVGEVREVNSPAPLNQPPAAPPSKLSRVKMLRVFVLALVLFPLLTFLWTRRPRPTPQLRLTALTTNAAELPVISAAISPDGRYLAYADSTGLYVRPMGTSETHRIETPPDALANFIDWFPDNSHLLVCGFDEHAGKSTVWSVSVLGGAPKALYQDASSAMVSPDGSRIAFISRSNQIWTAQSDGSSPRIFAALPDSETFADRVQFSPDGNYLLVVRGFYNSSPRSVVEARRLQDGKVTILFDNPKTIVDFLLLPDGELWISQQISDDEVSTHLLKVRVDIAAATTSPPQTVADWPEAWTYWLSATRDGKRVVLIKDRSQSDVYIADLAPSGTAITNPRRLTLDDSKDRPSAWLPDSHTVIFHSDRSGPWGIYRQAIDQQRAETVVVDAHQNFWPQVTPDRKSILYFSSDDPKEGIAMNAQVVRRPIAGGPAEIVDKVLQLRHLHCPRQGKTCVMLEQHGDQEVFYQFDPQAGRGKELARMDWSAQSVFDWDISPDGRHIAAVVPHDARNTIALFSLQTTPATRKDLKVPSYQSIHAINWDAKGEGFYASSFDQFAGVLIHISLEGKTAILHHVINNAEGWAIPSPDGRHLAYQEWTLGGNVWMLER